MKFCALGTLAACAPISALVQASKDTAVSSVVPPRYVAGAITAADSFSQIVSLMEEDNATFSEADAYIEDSGDTQEKRGLKSKSSKQAKSKSGKSTNNIDGCGEQALSTKSSKNSKSSKEGKSKTSKNKSSKESKKCDENDNKTPKSAKGGKSKASKSKTSKSVEPGKIGNFVWKDNNQNGRQDPGEPGLKSVLVKLLDCSTNTVLQETTTNSDGKYSLNNLEPGEYRVAFSKQGYGFTSKQSCGDYQKDSDANLNGITDCIHLNEGEKDNTIDAGMVPLEQGRVGNMVWEDKNENGIMNSGEPGVSGVVVELYKCGSNNLVESTTTNAQGKWSIDDLEPGNYRAKVIVPEGYELTTKNAGSNDEKDSDANKNTGFTDCYDIDYEETEDTIDFGLIVPQSSLLGGRTFTDKNANGFRDSGDSGLSGVIVKLYQCGYTDYLYTTTTDNSGKYVFSNLASGQYQVEFVLKEDFSFSPKQQSDNHRRDSDADELTGFTDCVTLGAGEENRSIDAGMHEEVVIGNRIWIDLNANGIQDPGEPSYCDGIHVSLISCSTGSVLDTIEVDHRGRYQFLAAPGDYRVAFELPDGYKFSPRNRGNDGSKDSDAGTSNGQSSCFSMKSGKKKNTIDAGIFKPASLGDFVWNDMNADGVHHGVYPGMEGVEISLFTSDGTEVDSTTSDAQGNYIFEHLDPGDYYLKFVPPTNCGFTTQDGGKDHKDSDVNPVTGRTEIIHLESGENDLTWDAGFLCPSRRLRGRNLLQNKK